MIRVVLVEDSATQREVLQRALEVDGDIAVVGAARNGREGLERIRADGPQVIVTDVWMPEMNGLELLRAVRAEFEIPVVVVSSSFARHEVDVTIECLAAGAVFAMEKPEGPAFRALPDMGPRLRETVRAASRVRIPRRAAAPADAEERPAARAEASRVAPPRVLGVVSSTGGPAVLAEILRALPAAFPVPILLVQHLSEPFEEGFLDWLGRQTALEVRGVEPGIGIEDLSGTILFARAGSHTVIDAKRRTARAAPDAGESHVPSGDRLLASLAAAFGKESAGAILSGMGTDGAAGLAEIRAAGGATFAQDKNSSLIWGMPGEAVRKNAAARVLSPAALAEAFRAWIPRRAEAR